MLQSGNIVIWLSHGPFWNLELSASCMYNGNWRKRYAFNGNTGNKLFHKVWDVSSCHWWHRILRLVFKVAITYCVSSFGYTF